MVGDRNRVQGLINTLEGDKSAIAGNENKLKGVGNQVLGNSNIISGDNNSVSKIKSQDIYNIQSIVASLGKSLYLSRKGKWLIMRILA